MAEIFDEIIDRRASDSVKWATGRVFGRPDVLPLWVADMDFKAPPAVIEALRARIDHGVFGYMIPGPGLSQAVMDWLGRRHAWQVEKNWISFSSGVMPALRMALLAFTHPGDKVIVQPPVYYPFFSAVKETGRQLSECPLIEVDGDYRMDFDALKAHLRDPRARMMILCSPHNPVGRVWRADELARVAELCLEHNILLISDEIHHDLVYPPHRHTPTAALSPEIARNTITLLAPSKTFNLAGLHTSVTVIPDEQLRKRFTLAQESAGLNHTTIFGALALETAYTQGEAWLEQVLAYLEGNLDFMLSFLAERLPQVKMRKPQGTYLAWVDFRALGLPPAELNRRLLEGARVGLNDGCVFGAGGEGFQRVNVGCPRAVLAQALQQIAAELG